MADGKIVIVSTSVSETPRNIIPRWRDSAIAATTGELGSISHPTNERTTPTDELTRRVAEWRRHRSVAFASDLISAGVVLGAENDPAVREAVAYVRSLGSDAPPSALNLADFVGNGSSFHDSSNEELLDNEAPTENARSDIRQLKSRVRNYPRNALAWANIARQYAILGANTKAIQSMRIGLALAPDSRFMLRSAARLYVHVGDHEQAYDVLRRNRATLSDPWLRAAEIAVAGLAEKTPYRLGRTKKNLRNTSVNPGHISELASAVATIELRAGSNTSARRFFNLGLEKPTENSVAQADWAQKSLNGISLTDSHFQLPRTFEANAVEYFDRFELSNCMQACQDWLSDEPFSSRPLELNTLISLVAYEDFAGAIDGAKRGLVSNPGGFLLRNNLSIALVEIGKIVEAKAEFGSIKVSSLEPWEKTCWFGTRGLLAFRQGDVQAGQESYRIAVECANQLSASHLSALARIFWAHEELRAGNQARAELIIQEAQHVIASPPSTSIKLALERYLKLKRLTASDFDKR